MKNSFINILREPDSVLFQFDDSGIRFEEPDSREEQKARLDYIIDRGCANVILYPSEKPIKRVKLRWRGDMSDVLMTLGDDYERMLYDSGLWTGSMPIKQMPWYFHAYDGEKLHGFGVKTGPNSFCTFYCDSFGISLWMDVRSGGSGVALKEPLVAGSVVCREGQAGETPYEAAVAFCKIMCEKPVLPKEPVFGVNNWYWAYGEISHDVVMKETAYLKEMCADTVTSPYMILDDGWQLSRYAVEGHAYNGGPWDRAHKGFPSMEKTADCIRKMGAKPGIWFRPLLTAMQVPAFAASKADFNTAGVALDPTHPFVTELVLSDVSRIRGWGYELIKHDFSTIDAMGDYLKNPFLDNDRKLYDSSITNCKALRNLYQTIQAAAGNAVVIGCNTINHLVAGIHAVQRVGADTSGRNFEVTRNDGVHTFVRLPQNGTFFAHDPDCAAFTKKVSHEMNLDFLEACAVTGAVTLASVTPGCLSQKEMNRIRQIYKVASEGGLGAVPADWLGNNEPSHFVCPDGRAFTFDWYRIYDGVRSFYTWTN